MYLLYLSLLILKAYSELRSMPYFGLYKWRKSEKWFLWKLALCCKTFTLAFLWSKKKEKKLIPKNVKRKFFLSLLKDMRLKFLTLLMMFVMAMSLTVTYYRFGFGILEDNFVAKLTTTYNSSAQFMCFYGLLNFYLYTMAYVYSPSGRPVHGKINFN